MLFASTGSDSQGKETLPSLMSLQNGEHTCAVTIVYVPHMPCETTVRCGIVKALDTFIQR